MKTMFTELQQKASEQISTILAEAGVPSFPHKWSSIPFSGEWGISTSFFAAAAAEARANPGEKKPSRAAELAELVRSKMQLPDGVARVEATNGYLNFYFSTSRFAQTLIASVMQAAESFGRGAPKGERVMVEFAQPNTHHSFHIGHYRNTVLGESLSRIVEFSGFDTVRASYPGDIGLGVITVLWAYDKFYRGKEPKSVHERGQWLLKLYAEATGLLTAREGETVAETAKREALDAERRDYYRRWDAGDPAVRTLWKETREWSLQELREILDIMGVRMDVWFYESEADEPAKQIVEELLSRGIADDERAQGGPVIVKIDEKLGLKKAKYRTNVVLRSDGTTLYLTKDLALARQKFEKYHVDRSIYVVDIRQAMHLQQAFAILRLMGFPQAEKCYHLGYGFVTLPEGAMSARKGRVVLFMDVFEEACRRVKALESDRTPDMPPEERERVARQVGLGALAYSMLSVDNGRDIVFDMDAALAFDGRTGPYIQNAYVRANSLLRKAGAQRWEAAFQHELGSHEVTLIDLLARFPDTVQRSAEEYRPLLIANYAYELATAFHSFYHAVPVLQNTDEKIRGSLLALVAAVRQTLANTLRLLTIEAPTAM